MKSYRKKPVVIQAVQIDDDLIDRVPNERHPATNGIVYDPKRRCAFIQTLEGTMRGDIGDWIIQGVKGEYYPCKPDIFVATYESA